MAIAGHKACDTSNCFDCDSCEYMAQEKLRKFEKKCLYFKCYSEFEFTI